MCYPVLVQKDTPSPKGVGRKFFQGGQRKNDQKLAKKYRKIALFSLFQGEGGATEKRPKTRKKGQKITLSSLYLLYLYHV